jgi:hypothetical protein
VRSTSYAEDCLLWPEQSPPGPSTEPLPDVPALLLSGLLGPLAGRTIDLYGGRDVLAATNVVFAAGLALLSFALRKRSSRFLRPRVYGSPLALQTSSSTKLKRLSEL